MKPLTRLIALSFLLAISTGVFSQATLMGTVMDGIKNKPLQGATISLIHSGQTALVSQQVSGQDGTFTFSVPDTGFLSIRVSNIGFADRKIDSIHVRADRMDFNLGDILMKISGTDLDSVVVYAEKPLYETKDGKIVFNAGESALSNSATTTELLKQTPLVNVDNDGKLTMRGKEVKVLIDDKPVDLDARQLQDLLESMPGSMIEKIEVLTTPPPQYATERGGVINIVTKKGKTTGSGRLNLNYGTRGELGASASYGRKKNKLNFNVTAGVRRDEYYSTSGSLRTNRIGDSTTQFKSSAVSSSTIVRPNGRLGIDYDFNKKNAASFVLAANANQNIADAGNHYENYNRSGVLYRNSLRDVGTDADGLNPSLSAAFTHKGNKDIQRILRFNGSYALSTSNNDRDFYQQYLDANGTFNGIDSTQQQLGDVRARTISARLQYEHPYQKKWMFFSGITTNLMKSENDQLTSFYRKSTNSMVVNPQLSSHFFFHQNVFTANISSRYMLRKDMYLTAGLQEEYSQTYFDIRDSVNQFRNAYFSSLPFVTLQQKWEKGYSLTGSYKRTLQRPGLNVLNPNIDYADPYNTRFGNPYLQPYYIDNFDLISGYWTKPWSINLSVGYNILNNIYSAIRTLQPTGYTTTTWQNISGRQEYEASLWGSFNAWKKIKLNGSVGYSYNQYSLHDRTVNRYRNGSSWRTNMNGNWQVNTLLNATGSVAMNRFANPQGTVRNNLSINLGVQQKLFKKNMTLSLSVTDPFGQQQNRNTIYGPNYTQESYTFTDTRNFRIALSYLFRKAPPKKTAPKKPVQKLS